MKKKHILHLVTKLPDKYNGKFIEFSEQYLSEYQHSYVTLLATDSINEERDLKGADIINLNALSRWQKMFQLTKLFTSKKYDLIVLHGLFYRGPFLLFLTLLYKLTKVGEKSLWMTWGGDIYYFQNKPKSFSGFMNERFRKSLIKQFFFISSLIPEEVELLRINYKTHAIQLDNFYPNPMTYDEDIAELAFEQRCIEDDNKFSFMLGNSADPQNNHLVMLDALAHLKGEIKIYCVLSYAIVDLDYVEQVKKRGIALFGDDFIALTEFMSAQDYKLLLSSIDFSCYYHNRQQAMGNIFHFLNMGKAVFIRGDIISFKFLQDHGLVVQDSNSLVDITLEQLAMHKQNGLANKAKAQVLVERYFSDLAAQQKWQVALRRVFSLLKKSD